VTIFAGLSIAGVAMVVIGAGMPTTSAGTAVTTLGGALFAGSLAFFLVEVGGRRDPRSPHT
jgi:hypothetical protein